MITTRKALEREKNLAIRDWLIVGNGLWFV